MAHERESAAAFAETTDNRDLVYAVFVNVGQSLNFKVELAQNVGDTFGNFDVARLAFRGEGCCSWRVSFTTSSFIVVCSLSSGNLLQVRALYKANISSCVEGSKGRK